MTIPNPDAMNLKELKEVLEQMSLEELRRFNAGMMNIITLSDSVFRNRFPEEHEDFVIENGWED